MNNLKRTSNVLDSFRNYAYQFAVVLCDTTDTANALSTQKNLNLFKHPNQQEKYTTQIAPNNGKYVVLLNSNTDSEFVNAFSETLTNLKTIFAASQSSSPVVIAGSGTLAMEIAMVNLIDSRKEQKALICDTGYFGLRFESIAQSFGLSYSMVSVTPGHRISAALLDEQLTKENPDFAFI